MGELQMSTVYGGFDTYQTSTDEEDGDGNVL